MSDTRNRRNRKVWIALGVVFVPVTMLTLIVGVAVYVNAMPAPLHPEPHAAPSVTRSSPPPRWSGSVDRARGIIRAALTEQNLPGLSVAVGVDTGLVWAEGFGWAEVASRMPVTPETRFRIGSASTLLTSAAVGVLLEQDRLTLDEEIQRYVREFPMTQQRVTLRQVMAHVGGIRTESADDRPLSRQRCERTVEAMPHVADGSLLFAPGSEYRYSRYGWILVSAAVESAADEPFLTFMRQQIFEPLAMHDTGAESVKEENPEHVGEPGEDPPPFTLVRHVILQPLGIGVDHPKSAAGKISTPATFYEPGFGYKPVLRHSVHVRPARNLSCYAGAMAFLSTPSDLVRFALSINNGTLLKPATVQTLQTSQQLTSGRRTGHGLGWDLDTVSLAGQPAQSVGHSGIASSGAAVSLMTFRERGIVVAVTSNITSADTSAVALRVAEAFAEPLSR
jgi:serine beta-lactamase-like protein LACTB